MDYFSAKSGGKANKQTKLNRSPTLFRVWVWPIRMRALEEMMDRQKLIRMTERSERIYLQQEKTRRGIHLVTACIKLPLGSINQALQKGHGKKLPISCRSCMLNRQEQGERGKGELGCSAHRSLYSPPSMLGVMSMSQQTSGQSGP